MSHLQVSEMAYSKQPPLRYCYPGFKDDRVECETSKAYLGCYRQDEVSYVVTRHGIEANQSTNDDETSCEMGVKEG